MAKLKISLSSLLVKKVEMQMEAQQIVHRKVYGCVKESAFDVPVPEHYKSVYRNKCLQTEADFKLLEKVIQGGGYHSTVLVTDYGVDGTLGRQITLCPESVEYFKRWTSPKHNTEIRVCGLSYHIPTQDRIDWLYQLVSSLRVQHGLKPYRGCPVARGSTVAKVKRRKS